MLISLLVLRDLNLTCLDFQEYSLDEDIIFCDKQCYFTNEFDKQV